MPAPAKAGVVVNSQRPKESNGPAWKVAAAACVAWGRSCPKPRSLAASRGLILYAVSRGCPAIDSLAASTLKSPPTVL